VSHAAVYSEVLSWFVVVLTLLLLMIFIGVVVRTPPRHAGSPQPPEHSPPAPPPPPFVRRPQTAGLADAGARPARAGYRPRHAEALKRELMAVDRRQASGGPPWEPAPKPPGLADCGFVPWLAVTGQVPGKASACRQLPPRPGPSPHTGSTSCAADMTGPDPGRLRSAQIAAASTPSGGRAGAHRQAHRRGAHRADISTGRERRSAGRTGRHRAGVH
jgi:hypothetical protein